MPTTSNFGWTDPTVGGDAGSWGTILNALFDAIDADLETVKVTADAAVKADGSVAVTSRQTLKALALPIYTVAGASGNYNIDLRLYSGVYINGTAGSVTLTLTNGNLSADQPFYVTLIRTSTAHQIDFVDADGHVYRPQWTFSSGAGWISVTTNYKTISGIVFLTAGTAAAPVNNGVSRSILFANESTSPAANVLPTPVQIRMIS